MITLVRSASGYLDVAIIRIPDRATTRDEAADLIADIPPGVKYIQLDMSRSIVLAGSYIDGLVKGILETGAYRHLTVVWTGKTTDRDGGRRSRLARDRAMFETVAIHRNLTDRFYQIDDYRPPRKRRWRPS